MLMDLVLRFPFASFQPHPVGGCDKRHGRCIAAHHLGAQLDACRQGCGVTVLLRKEQGLLLHRQAGVDLAEDPGGPRRR